jgi:hypothetical protein
MFLTSARASKKNPWCASVGRQIGDRGGAIRRTGDTHVQQEADGPAHKQSDKVFHERAIELQQTAPTLIGPPGRLTMPFTTLAAENGLMVGRLERVPVHLDHARACRHNRLCTVPNLCELNEIRT